MRFSRKRSAAQTKQMAGSAKATSPEARRSSMPTRYPTWPHRLSCGFSDRACERMLRRKKRPRPKSAMLIASTSVSRRRLRPSPRLSLSAASPGTGCRPLLADPLPLPLGMQPLQDADQLHGGRLLPPGKSHRRTTIGEQNRRVDRAGAERLRPVEDDEVQPLRPELSRSAREARLRLERKSRHDAPSLRACETRDDVGVLHERKNEARRSFLDLARMDARGPIVGDRGRHHEGLGAREAPPQLALHLAGTLDPDRSDASRRLERRRTANEHDFVPAPVRRRRDRESHAAGREIADVTDAVPSLPGRAGRDEYLHVS